MLLSHHFGHSVDNPSWIWVRAPDWASKRPGSTLTFHVREQNIAKPPQRKAVQDLVKSLLNCAREPQSQKDGPRWGEGEVTIREPRPVHKHAHDDVLQLLRLELARSHAQTTAETKAGFAQEQLAGLCRGAELTAAKPRCFARGFVLWGRTGSPKRRVGMSPFRSLERLRQLWQLPMTSMTFCRLGCRVGGRSEPNNTQLPKQHRVQGCPAGTVLDHHGPTSCPSTQNRGLRCRSVPHSTPLVPAGVQARSAAARRVRGRSRDRSGDHASRAGHLRG